MEITYNTDNKTTTVNLTGLDPNPSIDYERVPGPQGHGGMSWHREWATLRFDASAARAREGCEIATPGHLGSLHIRLNMGALTRLRDEIDALIGIGHQADAVVAGGESK